MTWHARARVCRWQKLGGANIMDNRCILRMLLFSFLRRHLLNPKTNTTVTFRM